MQKELSADLGNWLLFEIVEQLYISNLPIALTDNLYYLYKMYTLVHRINNHAYCILKLQNTLDMTSMKFKLDQNVSA